MSIWFRFGILEFTEYHITTLKYLGSKISIDFSLVLFKSMIFLFPVWWVDSFPRWSRLRWNFVGSDSSIVGGGSGGARETWRRPGFPFKKHVEEYTWNRHYCHSCLLATHNIFVEDFEVRFWIWIRNKIWLEWEERESEIENHEMKQPLWSKLDPSVKDTKNWHKGLKTHHIFDFIMHTCQAIDDCIAAEYDGWFGISGEALAVDLDMIGIVKDWESILVISLIISGPLDSSNVPTCAN